MIDQNTLHVAHILVRMILICIIIYFKNSAINVSVVIILALSRESVVIKT